MQIQSKALPRSFSLRRTVLGFTATRLYGVVLVALFAIVQIDLHSAQLQAIGLLGQVATGINPVFLSP